MYWLRGKCPARTGAKVYYQSGPGLVPTGTSPDWYPLVPVRAHGRHAGRRGHWQPFGGQCPRLPLKNETGTNPYYWRVSLKPDRKTADKTAKINSDGRALCMTARPHTMSSAHQTVTLGACLGGNIYKKLSYRREAARCLVLLSTLVSHWRLL